MYPYLLKFPALDKRCLLFYCYYVFNYLYEVTVLCSSKINFLTKIISKNWFIYIVITLRFMYNWLDKVEKTNGSLGSHELYFVNKKQNGVQWQSIRHLLQLRRQPVPCESSVSWRDRHGHHRTASAGRNQCVSASPDGQWSWGCSPTACGHWNKKLIRLDID